MLTNVWDIGLKELSEFGCIFAWYFYRFRCNLTCFCRNYKYDTDRTLGDRLDSNQFRGGNRPTYFWSCKKKKTFTGDEDVIQFRSTQDQYPD